MPGPDPQAIWLDEDGEGRVIVPAEVFLIGNRAARLRRARAVLRNILRNDWSCAWCCEPVPLFRRADARFCGEGCRKRAARERRGARAQARIECRRDWR